MRKTIVSTVFVATMGLAAASVCNAAGVLPADDDEELVPTGKGWGQRVPPGLANQRPGNGKPTGNNGIVYHGVKSCRTGSSALADRRMHTQAELGIPSLLLESDIVDPRAISKAQMKNRADALYAALLLLRHVPGELARHRAGSCAPCH